MKIKIEKRPWGNFERFTLNEKTTVKIITVKKGEAFSLQYHKNRKEFWYILNGKATATIGNNRKEIKKGDRILIGKNTKHRMEAKEDITFLEISFGEFDEKDIVRLTDKYGRK